MYANIIVQLSKSTRELCILFCDGGLDTAFSHHQPINMWGIYTILVIGEWPVLFLVKRELAILRNVNCE